MDNDAAHLSALYDSLWQDATSYFAQGQVQVDLHLVDQQHDKRLGITVIARPPADIVEHFAALNARLAQIAPEQYFYQRLEFHITVLSLFTATDDFAPYMARQADYLKASQAALASALRFPVDFRGVTASRGVVMAQGFPLDDGLEQLRKALRASLREWGLDEGLDTRYQIVSAHCTLMRFRSVPVGLERLVEMLRAYRNYYFGCASIQEVQIVENDWYMSSGKVKVLQERTLG